MTANDRPLHIFIVATEESGDRLGAPLMREIAARAGRPVRFSGVGGETMIAHGLRTQFPIGELAIVGIDAVLAKLPKILRLIRETAAAAVAVKPDLLLIIDSPDFTHRVARKVRKAMPTLPIVDYVSPSVWAWRPGRAKAMRVYVDHLLALLPFEPQVHKNLGGPPCTYVGHPLAEAAVTLRPNAQELVRRDASPPLLLVLPGSRNSEVSRLAALFGEVARLAVERCGPLEIVVPTVLHVAERVRAAVAAWQVPARVTTDPQEKLAAFRSARAALAASGTVTLELAVAGVPTVLSYKISFLEEIVGHLFVGKRTIGLSNLVLGEVVMPEVLQHEATAENLTRALVPIIQSSAERQRQLDAFARLDDIMGIGRLTPSVRAAEIVLALASGQKPT
jgi:lipid-A-disaccharide synthase